ncbi:beta-propeller fold lactonase family protein [Paraburkholderia caballeronis]|uniref:40-residue YVTN family beta-propeller repeat-containing protein n=1 Tax=Paraburkholderia caballeronis TaxID=416943 RepID=A0A1H7LKF5_9BURK|nr:beta-propeller fold lactonase family protein [Paraburkholderia caballeronis]PXW28500.1 YVTN family beta-propeller protein [Paraburkholderia caballeronis]PXX03866.1 YVTN family beta-propeller protein [Paraburkholderia caballeronis]RAK04610.1 YVTN family beta-propeller protein [Paraburkholderia caballeronis]TDV19511.1 YVTN family beta-propeller protein [Paraburkholderia caballeronis]TDV22111.1 YVTN family beta-propeller protein [Paraburkholderia caballeronis]
MQQKRLRFPRPLRPVALAVACALAAGTALAAAAPPNAYVTSEKAGVGVIDLDQMSLTKTFPVGADGPRGLSLTADGKLLLVANKNTGDLAAIDTATGDVVQRVKIGKNPEYVRVHRGFAYVTYEPGENGPPPGAGGKPDAGRPDAGKPDEHAGGGKPGADDDANEPPAEIAIVDLKTWRVVHSVTSGHETEGVEFSRDGNEMLVTNEGDDTVSVYHARTGAPIRTVKLAAGGRPRGIRLSPDGSVYVVTLESLSKFVVLDAHDLKVLKTVDTKLGPYGIAYGPDGKRLFVAAARDKALQVFDAKTYEHVADVPVGQRCWHFSFTPDGSKLLVACGRSDAVYVLDARSYQPLKQIGDLPLAWGIVTWPASDGSIVSH